MGAEASQRQMATLGTSAAVLILAALLAGAVRPDSLSPQERRRREAQVAAMSAQQQAQLRKEFLAFEQLSPEDRDRLRELDRAVNDDANRDELLQVMQRYADWLGEMSFPERNALTSLRADKRIDEVTRRRVAEYRLEPDDVRAAAHWVRQTALERFRRNGPADRAAMPEPGRSLTAIRRIDEASRSARVDDRDFFAPQEVDVLVSHLSEEAQRRLALVSDEDRRKVLIEWLRQGDLRRELRHSIESEISREDVFAHFQPRSEEERRRLEREWDEDREGMRRRVFFEYEMNRWGPRGRRGPPRGGPPDGEGPDDEGPDGGRPPGPGDRRPYDRRPPPPPPGQGPPRDGRRRDGPPPGDLQGPDDFGGPNGFGEPNGFGGPDGFNGPGRPPVPDDRPPR
ncbi:MAG: hypothetical protein R3C10_20350 [Pirellulales bacterium]